MRDLLSKLDAIISETALNSQDPKGDYEAKKKALDDLEADPVAAKEPEISSAIDQRRADLEKEAKQAGVFEIGDAFGISFSENFEIGSEIVGFVEDGIVIDLDETSLQFLEDQGVIFYEGELSESLEEGRGPCWVGYKQVGMKKKGGKQVPNCVAEGSNDPKTENVEDDSDQEEWYDKNGRPDPDGAYDANGHYHLERDVNEVSPPGFKGTVKAMKKYDEIDNPYALAWSMKNKGYKSHKKADGSDKKEDHGPENPDADYNVGEYDREGDMAKDDLRTINDAAKELYSIIQADENLPEWVQAKINRAMDYLDTARDYMKANKYAENTNVDEAEYRGKNVPLGKKLPGDVKKSKVYVRKPNGNIVKVNFGDKKMRIKKSNPARRRSFRARHNCKNPGPRWKARYWSCRSW